MADAQKQISQEVSTQIETAKKELAKQSKDFTDADTKYKKALDKRLTKLPEETAIETSLHVVGESYYKWDSTTTYFPTLTFLFREINASQYPRKSQIKVRLKKRNEELTSLDVEKLKVSCRTISTLSYTYGSTRANYVSSDKRFKTTVFVEAPSTASYILKTLCSVIEEPFLEQNLSITTGRVRQNVTRRKTPLAGRSVTDTNYLIPFRVQLCKVVLLVNGLSAPLEIYRPNS